MNCVLIIKNISTFKLIKIKVNNLKRWLNQVKLSHQQLQERINLQALWN